MPGFSPQPAGPPPRGPGDAGAGQGAVKGRAAGLIKGALLFPCVVAGLWKAEARPTVGGQAVLEGVMMRGPERWTVTVRRADGRLSSTVVPYRGWAKKRPVLGRPFLRGAVVLLESMIVGLKALNYSAEIAAGDEEKKAETVAAEGLSEASPEPAAAAESAPAPPKAAAEAPAGTGPNGGPARDKEKPVLGFWTLALTLLSAFALAMGLFVALPHVASIGLGQLWGFNESSGWFHLVDGIIKFALFIAYVWGIGFLPDIGRVYAYHGAEHQAIFTYEAGEDLTPERAARHSAWHPRCGTAFIFLVLALSILFFAAVFPMIFDGAGASFGRTVLGIVLKIFLMLPLAGLAYEVTRLAGRASARSFWRFLLWPGLLMQRLTTRKPDRAQLEVALDALTKAVAPR